MGRGREVGYVNASVFGKAVEAAAEYLPKGWLVAVDGRLEYGEWETEAGEKHHDYSVVGNVECLTAPKPVEEPAPVKPARREKEAVSTCCGQNALDVPAGLPARRKSCVSGYRLGVRRMTCPSAASHVIVGTPPSA